MKRFRNRRGSYRRSGCRAREHTGAVRPYLQLSPYVPGEPVSFTDVGAFVYLFCVPRLGAVGAAIGQRLCFGLGMAVALQVMRQVAA